MNPAVAAHRGLNLFAVNLCIETSVSGGSAVICLLDLLAIRLPARLLSLSSGGDGAGGGAGRATYLINGERAGRAQKPVLLSSFLRARRGAGGERAKKHVRHERAGKE